MYFQGVGCGWRPACLMFMVFVQMMIPAGAARADAATEARVITEGEVMIYGRLGVWVKVAFASTSGHKILWKKDDPNLYMPKGTNLTLTVTCGTVADWPTVGQIVVGDGGFGQYLTDTSGSTSVSYVTGPLEEQFGSCFSFGVVFNSKWGAAGSPQYINWRLFTLRPEFWISANAPGDPEDPYNTWGRSVDDQTADKDIFNTKFKVHVVKPVPQQGDGEEPAVGARVRVWYAYPNSGNDAHTDIGWTSDWGTSDANGDATVVLGEGTGPTIAAKAGVLGPELYLRVTPTVLGGTATSPGYLERVYVLPQFARFVGSLEFVTRDMDNHPMSAHLQMWGGGLKPQTVYNAISDSAGRATLKIQPPGVPESSTIEHFETQSPPRVNLEWIYTQLVDFPGKLTDKIPCYISPRYTLHPEAYTYDPTGAGSEFPRCSGGRIELLDDASGKIIDEKPVEISFFQPNQSKPDNRRDRKFLPVRATRELKGYIARVVFDDPDGGTKDGKLSASEELHYNIQATAEPRNPKPYYNIEVVTCAVGAWSGDEEGSFDKRVPPANMQMQMENFAEMFPGPVDFRTGGTIQPSFWPWQSGPWVVSALISQLQERQRASAGMDLVVGIVPPGWLQAFYRVGGGGQGV